MSILHKAHQQEIIIKQYEESFVISTDACHDAGDMG